MSRTTKIMLEEREMPRQWYNLAADLRGRACSLDIVSAGLSKLSYAETGKS